MGLAYNFRSLVYYHHDRNQGSRQAEMVLEKELRVLLLDLQAAKGKKLYTENCLGIYVTPNLPPQ